LQQGRVSGLRALLPIEAAENNESQKSLTRPSAQTQPTLGHPIHIAWSASASVKQVEVNVRLCTIPESVYTSAFPDQPDPDWLADPDAEAPSGNSFSRRRLQPASLRPTRSRFSVTVCGRNGEPLSSAYMRFHACKNPSPEVGT
jgi:hypothetical protein